MNFALPESPLWILGVLAIPSLFVVVPWRVGWLATFAVLLWADSSMVGAEIPRRIQWRILVLGMLFLQGLIRLRGRGVGTRVPLPAAGLVALAMLSVLWSETRFPSFANAAALGLLVSTAFLFVARYAPTPAVATQTVERAVVLVLVLVALGFVGRLRADELSIAGRLRGFFGNPNGLGITCALVAPWAAVRATREAGSRRAVAGGLVGVLVLLAFLSGSRTGLGGLIVGTGTALFLRHPSRFLLAMVLGGVALSIAAVARGGDIDLEEGAVGTLTRTETVSRLSGRLARWEEGIGRFREAPLLGHGQKASWGYDTTRTADTGEGVAVTAAGTNYHSQHIETLVDLGVVGEALLLLLLADAWRRARSLAARRDEPMAAAAGAAFAGTFVAAALDSFFHNWLLTPGSPYAFFFWSLFALCVRLHRAGPSPRALQPAAAPRPLVREPAGVA